MDGCAMVRACMRHAYRYMCVMGFQRSCVSSCGHLCARMRTNMCACVRVCVRACVRAWGRGEGDACGAGHVEERGFRPGEVDEHNGAHPKFERLRGGMRACVQPCMCVVGAWATRWRGVRLLFCRWRVAGGVRTM